jgi:hypothetical protein
MRGHPREKHRARRPPAVAEERPLVHRGSRSLAIMYPSLTTSLSAASFELHWVEARLMRRTDEEAHVCRKVGGFYPRDSEVSRVETQAMTGVSGVSDPVRSEPPARASHADSAAGNKAPIASPAAQQMGIQTHEFNIWCRGGRHELEAAAGRTLDRPLRSPNEKGPPRRAAPIACGARGVTRRPAARLAPPAAARRPSRRSPSRALRE